MLTVQCPHCSTALKLQQAPPAGKVKCPRCNQIVPVRSQRPAAAARASRPVNPDDDGFDFGRINIPSAGPAAVSQFPVDHGQLAVYDGPIPNDPLEAAVEGGELPEGTGPAQAAPEKKKTSPLFVVGALLGVGLVVAIGGVGAVIFSGGLGDSKPKVDLLAELKATAPADYQAVEHYGCVALLPKGEAYGDLSTAIDYTMVESQATGSVFFFGAMNGGVREIDEVQMRKKAGRQLGGEFLGGTATTRNNYKGIKGKLDGSLFVPNMMVEAYHHDGRFVIIGVAPAGFEADPSVQMRVDHNAVQAEQEAFYKSFKIGPMPSGWF